MNNGRCSIPPLAVLLGILCIFSSESADSGQTERIIALPELESPRQIVVEKGRVYFVDRRDVVVYNLSDGRFLKKIGRLGQGPGEFSGGPSRLSVLGDRLIVKDLRSFECFNLEGIYTGGVKEPDPMGFYPFLPVGRNFVGFPMIRNDDGSLTAPSGRIYDSNLKLKRKFFGELPALPSPPPPPGSAKPTGKSDKLLIRDYGATRFTETGSTSPIPVGDSRSQFSMKTGFSSAKSNTLSTKSRCRRASSTRS